MYTRLPLILFLGLKNVKKLEEMKELAVKVLAVGIE